MISSKGSLKLKVAHTTLWLALFFAVSDFPRLVVYLFREVLPFFQPGFHYRAIRLAETIFQLNSVFDPLLYWYRNRRLRKAALKLLRCRNTPAPGNEARHIRQRRYSVASLDVEKLQREQTGA